MLQRNLIDAFLNHKEIAVVGTSRKGDLPANLIYQKLKKAGYRVFPINPNAKEIDGDPCFSSVVELPDSVKAVVLAGTPDTSLRSLDDCATRHIEMVWMHRGIGNGSYSKEAEAKAKQLGIPAIVNGCPMMFIARVDPFHRVFRWLKS